MENVPKIVSQRLRAQTSVVDHPDADLLTAFAERLLPDTERNRVLQHLAGCRDCRDVVALALPAEQPATEILRPARGSLLTWPRLRWGLVAAGVIVVGSFAVLHYRNTTNPSTVAMYKAPQREVPSREVPSEEKKQPASQPESAGNVQLENPEPASPSVAEKAKRTVGANKEFDRLEQFGKLRGLRDEGKAVADSKAYRYNAAQIPHGPKPPSQLQQNTGLAANSSNANQLRVPAPAPPASMPRQPSDSPTAATAPAVAASGAGGSIGGPLKQSPNLDTVAINRSDAPLAGDGSEVTRAKPTEPVAAGVAKAPAGNDYSVSAANGRNFSELAVLTPEKARWSINASGGLQRSFDQGKTWEDVDVNSRLGAADASDMQLAMKSSVARAAAAPKDKADRKQAPVVFRAVAANGPDVWAGGSGGYIYHSADSGAHWLRIQPSWGGINLTGDVISLQFFDSQHGRVMTSTAEIWTTADAGETWEKH